jgi:hypothetical protein
MVSPLKVVQFSNYQKPQGEVSHHSKTSEKIASQSDSEKTPEPPGNLGLPAIPDTTLCGNSEEQPATPIYEKKKATSKPKTTDKPVVLASAGPDGHNADCATMSPGQLQAAYKSEYQSWKNSKSRAKKKGWPWASQWDGFKGFLLSMGPKPDPSRTLDRKDNAVQEYGPGLCQWASKTVQNNNKSDNLKFVVPLTGEVWTPKKLALLHNVSVKTIYKRIENHYCILELVAGKKSKPLHVLWVKLDELPAPTPAKKVPLRPLKLPEFHYPYADEWYPIEDDAAHYQETGQMRTTHYLAYRAEYDTVAKWTALVNTGLPYPAFPQLKYLKIKPPSKERLAQLHLPLPPKPKSSPSHTWASNPRPNDDGHDPADCLPNPDEEC